MKSLILNVSNRLFTKKAKKLISCSDILKGIQCEKLFWLQNNIPRDEKESSSCILKKMIKDEVESKAKELFKNGYSVNKKGAIADTKKALAEGRETIFDALFEHNGILIKIDVLEKCEQGYSFYEIKSGSGIKDVYFNEAAIKWNMLMGYGLPLYKAYIIHINNKYLRIGDLNIDELFIKRNVTSAIKRRQDKVAGHIHTLQQIDKIMPQIDIGPWCNDPYECGYKSYCWKNIPSPSIFDLHKLPGKKKFELYKKGMVRFEDIPADFELKDEQKRQINAELDDKGIIDKKRIGTFLTNIHFPIYFLDFETFQQAIPKFENLRPYEQIPFQFSLHILKTENSEPIHIEFLAHEGSDPRKELAEELVKSIGENGTILAYNQSFEKSVIKRLAEQFPDISESLILMLHRFNDLMEPFEKGMYYTKEMNGSHSIKAVLPALVPELSYKLLDIQHGGEAMNEYSLLCFKNSRHEADKIRESLLEYCKLDTLAMLEIWKKLKSSVQ